MRRRTLVGISGLGAALLAVPATVVLAQGVPPGPPATFYGSAAGATPGSAVVAIVLNGNDSAVCGSGVVTTDSGAPVYVVDVVSSDQKAGCGAAGRQVRFYFTPSPGNPGRLANETATWTGAGPKQQALTPGAPLTQQRFVPLAASDGVNQ